MSLSVGLDISALDPSFKSHAGRGIGRYVAELKNYFDSHHTTNLQVDNAAQTSSPVLKVDYFDHLQLRLKSQLGERVERMLDLVPLGKNTIRQQLFYPLKLSYGRTKNFDFLHFPAHMDPPCLSAKPYIVTVLDLIPFVLKELYASRRSSLRYNFARWLEIQAIKRASLILAISECTARDIVRVLDIPAERIIVTPLGVDKRFFEERVLTDDHKQAVRKKLNIPQQRAIILYVGGIDPRKNYRCLLESIKLCIDQSSKENKPLLCMAGKIQQDEEYPKLLNMIKQLDLSDSVVLPGYVSDADLLDLLSICQAVHFPSLYEGFGLPALEAMAAGVPVVCSNSSSMPEVVSSAGLMVDPTDVRANAEALISILRDHELSAKLKILGRAQAQKFTWIKTGEATFKAYRQFARLSA